MTTPPRPKRVLFGVTTDYQLRYHNGLFQRLAVEGWDVHIVSGHGTTLERLSRIEGVTVHALTMARAPRPFKDLSGLLQWVRLLRRVRPTIMVNGTPKASLLGNLAGWFTRIRVRIYEVHGLRLESARGGLRVLLVAMERLTSATATHVIPVGRSLRERILSYRLARKDKTEIIGDGSPNGVAVERFMAARADRSLVDTTRASLGLAPSDAVVLFVGRLTDDKGLVVLADAMVGVERETGARLVVVGGSDDASGEAAAAYLRSRVPGVIFTGDVCDVAPYLVSATVFCLPSRREGLPTVILEAFAAGVPVVATSATGIVDLVEDGKTGRLVPIDDSDRLCEALIEALDPQGVSESWARRAQATVKERYSSSVVQERWTRRLTELYGG